MKITDAGKGYFVLDGANLKQRQYLQKNLLTEVNLEGDRVYFKPNESAMDFFEGLTGIVIEAKYKSAKEVNNNYTFAHKMEPYEHQDKILTVLDEENDYGLLWEVGLGKTKSILDDLARKFINGKVNALIVIALRGVHTNWVTKEIPEHLCVPCEAQAWPIKKADNFLRHDGLIVATMNFDVTFRKQGLDFLKRILTQRKCMFVIDEVHEMKNPTAKRTKAIMQLRKLARTRRVLSGTVVPNSPLDLWAPMEFLNPKILNMNYFQFKHRYAIEVESPNLTYSRMIKGKMVEFPVKQIVGYKNLEELNGIIKPYVSRLTKDILNLPPTMYTMVPFELSAEQRKVYNEVVKEKMSEYKGKLLTPNASLTLRIRLNQISCGFFKADDGTITRFKENPRLDALELLIEQIPRKFLLWGYFQEVLDDLEKMLLRKLGPGNYVVYTGKDDERTKAVDDFQTLPNKRSFLSSAAKGGTGLTLTAADYAIYYNNSNKMKERLQSEGRPHRIGQTMPVTYADLVAQGTKDMDQIRAFKQKMEMAAIIQGDELREWLI